MTESLCNQVQDSAINGEAGHQAEHAPIVHPLLMDSDKVQIISVEDQSGEVSSRQLGRPGWQSKGSPGVLARTKRDRSAIDERLGLAPKLHPWKVYASRPLRLSQRG